MSKATESTTDAAGLPARRFAFSLVTRVLDKRATLDEASLALASVSERLPGRDAAFGRAIAYAALRHKGSLEAVIAHFLDHPLPEHGLAASRVLLCGAAELLILDAKPHAAVDGGNRLALANREAKLFRPLINAILRRISEGGAAIAATLDRPRLDTPDWLWERWEAAYGPEAAHAVAKAHGQPAPLDLTARTPAERDALETATGALRLCQFSLRLARQTAVEELPGFGEGAFWVQDAAAALPARILLDLLDDADGRPVIDLCAAPGGKTLQLASAGASVTAVDSSGPRMKRLEENLRRTGFKAHLMRADARSWQAEVPAAAILLDAPCSATGTIRRHPELPWIRDEGAITRNAALSGDLLDAAWTNLAPGGVLVFAVCSLEPEEGGHQIERFLSHTNDAQLAAIDPARFGFPAEAALPSGAVQLLPSMLAEQGGLDGFFIAALRKERAMDAPAAAR